MMIVVSNERHVHVINSN